jgi:hypothetical protein
MTNAHDELRRNASNRGRIHLRERSNAGPGRHRGHDDDVGRPTRNEVSSGRDRQITAKVARAEPWVSAMSFSAVSSVAESARVRAVRPRKRR